MGELLGPRPGSCLRSWRYWLSFDPLLPHQRPAYPGHHPGWPPEETATQHPAPAAAPEAARLSGGLRSWQEAVTERCLRHSRDTDPRRDVGDVSSLHLGLSCPVYFSILASRAQYNPTLRMLPSPALYPFPTLKGKRRDFASWRCGEASLCKEPPAPLHSLPKVAWHCTAGSRVGNNLLEDRR